MKNVANFNFGSYTTDPFPSAEEIGLSRQGGRLTSTSGVPLPHTDVSSVSAVHYEPYSPILQSSGNSLDFPSGDRWYRSEFSRVSWSLTGLSAGSNYDIYLCRMMGRIIMVPGRAWSTNNSRGTGSGTAEIVKVRGRFVNKWGIPNGPASGQGLVVGTIRASGATTTQDTERDRWVASLINPEFRRTEFSDTTAHTYSSGTIRNWRALSDANAQQSSLIPFDVNDGGYVRMSIFMRGEDSGIMYLKWNGTNEQMGDIVGSTPSSTTAYRDRMTDFASAGLSGLQVWVPTQSGNATPASFRRVCVKVNTLM